MVITVIDYDTKQPVANAMVSLYDEFNAFIANLGFTDNSGVIMFADFTLSPGGYWFQAGAAGYMMNRVSYTVLSEAPINDEIEIAIQKPLIPPSIDFIVKDKETGAGIANAYVYLRDGNHQMLMQLGITDSSGKLSLANFTLEHRFVAYHRHYNIRTAKRLRAPTDIIKPDTGRLPCIFLK